jgi:hypothetical protein
VNTAPEPSFTSARASVSASSACEYAVVKTTGIYASVDGVCRRRSRCIARPVR